jgi:YHS domain-containing protein
MKTHVLLWALLVTAVATAQTDPLRIKHYNIKNSLALEGYDAVSYHQGKPMEGTGAHKVVHRGITYLFANAANASTFKSAPEKYEPAYGGWCAYAMGETGEKVKVDPETYKLINGKLYLFYNFWGNNTLTDWNVSEKALKEKADQHWLKIYR